MQFTPIDPVFLDPVTSGFLNGPQVCGTCTNQMASGGHLITGVAADGVTQAVVRIPANTVGETLKVTVQDENGNPCSGEGGVANDGGVFALGGSSGSADCNVDVTAVATTSDGPMAFVVYLSPVNYARGAYDYSSSERAISLQIQSDDDPNYMLTANASVMRPPVLLVHGLWGTAGDWANFSLPINGIDVDTIDYYYPLLQGVTGTNPTYPSFFLNLNNIPTSALGFGYNAPLVDGQIRQGVADFRQINNAAAVTADVVAHSMGGDIVRTIALGSSFQSNDTYGHGPIDKLITIGTPHLGSPLATDLLQNANDCLRPYLAVGSVDSFITVTTSAGPPINGGVGDLQGDGFGDYETLSPALQQLFNAGPLPFAMARIGATTQGGNNLNNLDCVPYTCLAWWLRQSCPGDPLAQDLTTNGWDTVFGQPNDAVVPILSQLNGGTAGPNTPTLMGVIHSPGLELLGFSPPTELDLGSDAPTQVIYLLNEPPNGSDFQASEGP